MYLQHRLEKRLCGFERFERLGLLLGHAPEIGGNDIIDDVVSTCGEVLVDGALRNQGSAEQYDVPTQGICLGDCPWICLDGELL